MGHYLGTAGPWRLIATDQEGSRMRVKLNGKVEDVQQGTVLDLLKARNIEPQMVSVEHNLKILEKDEFATTMLREGDSIEFLYYMGGGG